MTAAPPILIAAGGTGGHMFPALALGQALLARGRAVRVITDRRGARYVDGELPCTVVAAGSPSGHPLAKARGLAQLALGAAQSMLALTRGRPVAAATFGGYASVPAALAAAAQRVPLLVHEQNAVFGRANRLVARFAHTLALSFEATAAVPAVAAPRLVTGNPTRPGFAAEIPVADPARFRLLVLGGSQGARVFSDVVPAALALLPEALRGRIELAQQCRPEDLERVRAAYAGQGGGLAVELAPFFTDVAARMAAADLVVTRSGASTVAELLALGRPSLLVPYLHAADDHQTANARALVEGGAALVLPQPEFTAERLAQHLERLMRAPVELATMAAGARALARPDAAERLADAVLALTGEIRA